jgi:hypothetical protein
MKPRSRAITRVHSPARSTQPPAANQYGVQRTRTSASPGRRTSSSTWSGSSRSRTMLARPREITIGAGSSTWYTRQSSDFQRSRR